MKTLKLMLGVAGGIILAVVVLTTISYLLARQPPRVVGSYVLGEGHAATDTAALMRRLREAKKAAANTTHSDTIPTDL